MLEQAVHDLRANNQDLRLILAYMERDAARFQQDLEAEMAKNAALRLQIESSSNETEQLQQRNNILEDLLEIHAEQPVRPR